jgi:hypothetical protein
LANKPNYFHHGKYTTIRQAVVAHNGEALAARQAFEALTDHERDCVIEFLKTLQVLPPGTPSLFVDENGQPKAWPPTVLTGICQPGDQISIPLPYIYLRVYETNAYS